MEIRFEVDGDVQLARSLSRFSDDVADLSPAFNEIVPMFYEMEAKQFASEGAYGGVIWPKLAEATLKSRNPLSSGKIMQLSGRLVGSLIGGSERIVRVEKLSLELGTAVPYAVYHQRGGGRLPARPLILLPESERKAWMKVIQRYLVTKMREVSKQVEDF